MPAGSPLPAPGVGLALGEGAGGARAGVVGLVVGEVAFEPHCASKAPATAQAPRRASFLRSMNTSGAEFRI
jgi:hypothetical protein